ncbi:hypothetical protein SUGI_0508970 [Cryptomeria japonica]|nr:hypothetical protein SUGI_0508970 [Cryptomeria japonica]
MTTMCRVQILEVEEVKSSVKDICEDGGCSGEKTFDANIVPCIERKSTATLVDSRTFTKIVNLENHVTLVGARLKIDAQVECQSHRLTIKEFPRQADYSMEALPKEHLTLHEVGKGAEERHARAGEVPIPHYLSMVAMNGYRSNDDSSLQDDGQCRQGMEPEYEDVMAMMSRAKVQAHDN